MAEITTPNLINTFSWDTIPGHAEQNDEHFPKNALDPQWDYVYFTMSIFWLIVGVPGNIMVICAILYYKELKLVVHSFGMNTNTLPRGMPCVRRNNSTKTSIPINISLYWVTAKYQNIWWFYIFKRQQYFCELQKSEKSGINCVAIQSYYCL